MSELTDRVMQIVESIPAGRVMTYGAVAQEARTGARVVARVLHGGGHQIPWWRVVNAEGCPYPKAAPDARDHFIDEATPLLDENDNVRVDLTSASWTLGE